MTIKMTAYKAKDYSHLKGLKGITDAQMEVHLTLYNGYVNRTNKMIEDLATLANENKHPESRYQELKRRLGWEFNGMRLHEYYFDAMKPGGSGDLAPENAFGALAAKQFGSVDAWKADLMGVAKMPGIGWAITYHDAVAGQVLNCWVDLHETGHPAGCRPVVVLDVWEHAFSVYLKPTERAKYLDDFFANVDWNRVALRVG